MSWRLPPSPRTPRLQCPADTMAATLDGKLVVAISSRALFDFEDENEVFEQGDDRAYMALQLERLDTPPSRGWRFRWYKSCWPSTPKRRNRSKW
jgi:hypothetical protein